jgi:hypothetical protein
MIFLSHGPSLGRASGATDCALAQMICSVRESARGAIFFCLPLFARWSICWSERMFLLGAHHTQKRGGLHRLTHTHVDSIVCFVPRLHMPAFYNAKEPICVMPTYVAMCCLQLTPLADKINSANLKIKSLQSPFAFYLLMPRAYTHRDALNSKDSSTICNFTCFVVTLCTRKNQN